MQQDAAGWSSRGWNTRLERGRGHGGGEQNKSGKKYKLIKNVFYLKSILTLSYYILRVLEFNYVLKLHKYTTLFVYKYYKDFV